MAGIAALYAVETIFSVLAFLAVALGLWARHLTKRELALNDWATIGALVSSGQSSIEVVGILICLEDFQFWFRRDGLCW